jgi:hypothetical protein
VVEFKFVLGVPTPNLGNEEPQTPTPQNHAEHTSTVTRLEGRKAIVLKSLGLFHKEVFQRSRTQNMSN